MRTILFLLVITMAGLRLPAQVTDDIQDAAVRDTNVAYAPLLLFTNGGGKIILHRDGQMLRVGQRYAIAAIPDRGFAFTNWSRVNEFCFTIVNYDTSGAAITNASTVLSEAPDSHRGAILIFTMEPVEVVADVPGVLTITESSGYQANFVPLPKRSFLEKPAAQAPTE
jgi:hypothetical protein